MLAKIANLCYNTSYQSNKTKKLSKPKETKIMGAESFANATANVGKNILDDPKFLKAAGRIGKRTLTAAGITRKTTFTRQTKFDTAGAMRAIQNPAEAGIKAAEQLRKDAPRIAFHLGRATMGAVFKQRQESAAAPPMAESYAEPSGDALAESYAQAEAGEPAGFDREVAFAAPEASMPVFGQETGQGELADAQAAQTAASHEYPLAR